MADVNLRRIESFQYPNAHLGHLSDAQQAALDAFKELCEKEGYYLANGKDGKGVPSHDDETMLRFLRARKFVPKDAFDQFKDTEEWRSENHLDDLYESIDINEFEATRRLYPQWTGRRDKRGIPVYVFEVAHLTSKTITAYEDSMSKYPPPVQYNSSKISPRLVRLFALYENLTRFVMPLCTVVKNRSHPETPISQTSNIVDISRVGLKQFWNLKGHMQDASTLATAHYPETLDRIFIIGAPAFFPTVWGWIKRWFDPITVSKIFILSSSNVKSTLEQYIDPANIPKKYGGELDFEFGMMPVLDPEIQESVIWNDNAPKQGDFNTFPIGPIKWVEESGEVKAVAVGTENGQKRKLATARLPPGISISAQMNGMALANTPINDSELSYLGTGVSTQPPDNGEELDEEIPPLLSSGTNTPSTDVNHASTVSPPKQELLEMTVVPTAVVTVSNKNTMTDKSERSTDSTANSGNAEEKAPETIEENSKRRNGENLAPSEIAGPRPPEIAN